MKYISLVLLVFLVGCIDGTKTTNEDLAVGGTTLIDAVSDFGSAAVDVVSDTVIVVADDVKEVGSAMTGPVGFVAVLAGLAMYARRRWNLR